MSKEGSPKPKKWLDPDKAFVVHPDMQEAMMDYNPSRDSFKEVFEARDEAVEDGEVYWNDDHDDEMAETARNRSKDPSTWIEDE